MVLTNHGVNNKAGRRTTIYRLTGVDNLRDALRSKYLDRDGFEVADVTVGERPALLLTGAMTKEVADWCAPVTTLTGAAIAISGATPAGVLVLRPGLEATDDPTAAYALTYGMGFQLLEPSRLDNLFGQRIAIRSAEPHNLRSLTVTTMDERSRTSRASIPQGDGLLGFGIGDIGEAVSRIVAIANLPDLSRADGKAIQVRGADALSVPIGLVPDEVTADLDMLEQVLAVPPPEALKVLEQLTAVKNPEIKERLDERLSIVLDGSEGTIGLTWPHERVDENGTPDSWLPRGLWPERERSVRQGQPEWSEIWDALACYPQGQRPSPQPSHDSTLSRCRGPRAHQPSDSAPPMDRVPVRVGWTDVFPLRRSLVPDPSRLRRKHQQPHCGDLCQDHQRRPVPELESHRR